MPVAPETWAELTRDLQADIALLEVSGGVVPGWGAVDGEVVRSLLTWCRDHDVPVALWVTDGSRDPASLGNVGELVARIFLDNAAWLDDWKRARPDVEVGVLPPAAQPAIHRPGLGRRQSRAQARCLVLVPDPSTGGGNGGAAEEVVWPALAELRLREVDVRILDGVQGSRERVGRSRRWSARHQPPAATGESVSVSRVVADVAGADGIPSWPIVEAGSAATPVVATPDAVAALPDDLAPLVTAAADAATFRVELRSRMFQPELGDREGLAFSRAVHASHTYAHRVDHLVGSVTGREPLAHDLSVSAIVPTNREHELDNVLANVARQAHRDVQLVVVAHGLDFVPKEIEARAADAGVSNVHVIAADPALTLGACMNLGVDAADGAFIAKMDDDNYYGRHYLTDLVAAFGYTEADIVGKWAHYVWLRSTGAVVLRFANDEHRATRLVQGGSILARADVVRELRFSDLPRRVDTDFLDRAAAAGVVTYSADRFNYVSVRGHDRFAHTWSITDSALLNKSGQLVFYGDPREHVDV
ncbi:MAG: glycosyltransferase [Propionibacteriales bacterium]|nr:glycosyltransferase [Propionibacteriales bacterium]